MKREDFLQPKPEPQLIQLEEPMEPDAKVAEEVMKNYPSDPAYGYDINGPQPGPPVMPTDVNLNQTIRIDGRNFIITAITQNMNINGYSTTITALDLGTYGDQYPYLR